MMFKQDLEITTVMSRQGRTLSAEVIPPRNGEEAAILEQIEALVAAGAQFLSVTRGAGGSLRAGSLPIAQTIKERLGVPCIAHFTCRDLTPEEVENQLVDHAYFGIRNVLALRGDPPADRPDWQPKAGSHPYAYQLIEQIGRLNAGQYLRRAGNPQQFCIGAAAYPEHPSEAERLEFFKRKVEAGARYAITQMLFDVEVYTDFIEKLAQAGYSVPVLVGTRVLSSQDQALRMSQRFGCHVPRQVLEGLPTEAALRQDPGLKQKGRDVFCALADRLQAAGAPGLHLFVLGDTVGSAEVIRRLLPGWKRSQ